MPPSICHLERLSNRVYLCVVIAKATGVRPQSLHYLNLDLQTRVPLDLQSSENGQIPHIFQQVST